MLESKGVNALPIVDREGRVVGVVSEADLLLKEERRASEPRRLIFSSRKRRTEERKKFGSTARALMSTPAITTRPDAPVVEAARKMHAHGVKQLPVVDDDRRVVGIVARIDLLKVFDRSDAEIRQEVAEDVLHHKLWIIPEDGEIAVAVQEGVVRLDGWVERKTVHDLIMDMVFGIEGVVSIDDRLSVRRDDRHMRAAPVAPWGVLPVALRRP